MSAIVGAGRTVLKYTIVEPYRAVVSVPGDPNSKEFGTVLTPQDPHSTPIARVVVHSGKVSRSAYDHAQILFEGPMLVEVFLKGEPSSRVFNQASFASVSGGRNPVVEQKRHGLLRSIFALGADVGEALGELAATAVGISDKSYTDDLNKLASEVHQLNAEIERAGAGDRAWFTTYDEFLHKFWPEASGEKIWRDGTDKFYQSKFPEWRTRIALHRERLAKRLTARPAATGQPPAKPTALDKPADPNAPKQSFLTRPIPQLGGAPVWAVGVGGLTLAAVIAAIVASVKKG